MSILLSTANKRFQSDGVRAVEFQKTTLIELVVCDLIVIIRSEINVMASFLNKEANLTYLAKVNSFRLISHSKLSPVLLNTHFPTSSMNILI